jgi:hypothetical protein
LTVGIEDGNSQTVDLSQYARDTDLHDAVTFQNADNANNNYLTIVGQTITRNLISLTDHITGILGITNGGTGADNASDARTNLGLKIGTDVQGYNADTSILGQSIESNEITNGTIKGEDIENNTIDATQLADNINVSEFTNDAGYLKQADLNDDDATNELNTDFKINGTDLEITDAGGSKTVALADINTIDSVNGKTGDVSLDTGDIAENGNLYFTDSRADARIAAAKLKDLSNVDTTGVNDGQVLT